MKFIRSEFNFFHPAYWFGDVDARPLGLFRIAFAALMLKEAIYHIFVAEMWYSDAGMFPARLLPGVSPSTPTPMSALSDTWMVVIFFVMWAVVALALLFGWQTRLMSVLNLFFLISVLNRNQLVVTGADSVMEALAFWSLFLPLGRCYSVDARGRSRTPPPTTFAFPVRLFQIQVALVYIFTTIFKLQGQTWPSGDALYMAMQIKMHTFPLADNMLTTTPMSILRTLTYLTLLIEGGFTVLVFAPIFQPYLRRAGLILGVLLHVGIGLVMNIPNFPLVMVISYIMFLDTGIVNWIDKRLEPDTPPDAATTALPPATQESPKGCGAVLMAIPRGMFHGAYRGVYALILALLMGLIIWGNLLTNELLAVRLNVPAMPTAIESDLRAAGLWQSWALFAPDPLRMEGWFGINGSFPGNDTHDLRGIERPKYYSGPLARWGKLEENLMLKDADDPLFSAWANYACRQYRPQGILGVQILLYSRATSLPGQAFLPYTASIVRDAICTNS